MIPFLKLVHFFDGLHLPESSTMSDYAHRPGGSLKFKGESKKYVCLFANHRSSLRAVRMCVVFREVCVLNTRSSRKKKKKSHSSAEHAKLADRDASIDKDKDEGMENAKVREGGVEGGGARKLTEAERRFEETQRQRVSLYPSAMERRAMMMMAAQCSGRKGL